MCACSGGTARNSALFGPAGCCSGLPGPMRSSTSRGAYGTIAAHLTGLIPMALNNPLWIDEHRPEGSGGGGPVLVFVHGSLDSSRSFTRVIRRLPDLATVVYDRRGYQRSRAALPLNTTVAGHVDDLLEVIGGRPSVVIGHSYGGSIALAAALRTGTSPILSVVAFEPPMPWLEHAMGLPGRTVGSERWARVDPDDPVAAGQEAERFFRRMVGDASWDRLPPSAKDDRRADGPALAAELSAIRLTDAPFDVSTMRVPVIYGMGGETIERRRDAVAWLVAHTPGAQTAVIPGAEHGAHLTHPDAFADLARAALALAGTPTGAHP